MTFPQIVQLETLSSKYSKLISKQGLHLLNKLLAIDSKERITALQALKHPFLKELYEQDSDFMKRESRVKKEKKKEKENNCVNYAKRQGKFRIAGKIKENNSKSVDPYKKKDKY